MIVDVKSDTLSLDVLPEEYKFYYKLDDYELPNRNTLIVLFSSLLTFELESDGQFSSSIIDFFILKNIILKSQNFNVELLLTENCLKVCKEFILYRNDILEIKDGRNNKELAFSSKLKASPYEDQISATSFLLRQQSGANTSSVGIGKTLSALAYFDLLMATNKIMNGVVFCLNENKYVWKNEILKHTNYSFKVVGNGTNRVVKDIEDFKQDLLIVHYDSIINDNVKEALINQQFNFCIYDEAHIFKNVKSKRSKAIFDIVSCNNPKYKVPLTGTPINQCPLEAYSILKLIRPTILPCKTRFDNHFCKSILIKVKGTKKKIPKIIGYKNLDQLKFMMDLYCFRKTHEDVKGFPPTVFSVKELELESDQRKLYDQIKDETYKQIAVLPEKAMNLDHILTNTLRLRQCLSHPAILGETDIGSIKFKYLDQLLEEILSDSNQKVVIWSTFRDTLELLEQKYRKQYGALLFYGSMENAVREANIARFSDPKSNHRLLLGITSLGTGGNFQVARTAIYIDEPIKRVELLQSRGRITRRNAVGTSHIISLVCKDTVDVWVRNYIAKLDADIDQVIDPDSKIIQKDELLEGLFSKEVKLNV